VIVHERQSASGRDEGCRTIKGVTPSAIRYEDLGLTRELSKALSRLWISECLRIFAVSGSIAGSE
jgi:hypothetical protein